MNQSQSQRVYKLKIASKEIIDSVKEVRRLQKNTSHYLNSKNKDLQKEYNSLREEIANVLKQINKIETFEGEELDKITKLETLKTRISKLDVITSGKIDTLIREDKINPKMATSLINDTSTAHNICKKLIYIATILFIENENLHEIGEEDEY